MISRRLVLALCCLALPAVVDVLRVVCVAVHAQAKPEPTALTPAEMTWEIEGGLALSGSGPSGRMFVDPPDKSK